MMTNETGSVKYECIWDETIPFVLRQINDLNNHRAKLYSLGFIGAYENGIGYGNISVRLEDKLFLITGTSTGHIETLGKEHYTKVTSYNFEQNKLSCKGPIKASAESMTHAAVYECDREINAAIHIHDKKLWDQLIDSVPTTSPEIEYGTPQMALEIFRLFKETDVKTGKILVMAGHEEGIISFGKTLREAMKVILDNVKPEVR